MHVRLRKALFAIQSEPENKAANPSLPLAEACGQRLPLNREAWLGSVQRGIPHTERTWWVWPLNSWFLRGPLPKHCATCQRPRAPVSLTKATTNYPRHVSRPAFSKELPLPELNQQFQQLSVWSFHFTSCLQQFLTLIPAKLLFSYISTHRCVMEHRMKFT